MFVFIESWKWDHKNIVLFEVTLLLCFATENQR